MTNVTAAQARLDELTKEVARKTLSGTLSNKRMDEIELEAADLKTQGSGVVDLRRRDLR